MNALRWANYWTVSFDQGPHMDARRGDERVARIVDLKRIERMPIMPHPGGRRRRLFLAIVNRGHGWGVVGMFANANKAKLECAKALEEVAA
jgi:hypothetical protein